MTNAVIYARYSSHNQTEQSIEGQLQECHQFAERNDYTVLHEYIDRAISGTTDKRPDFQQMIEDSSKRQFQYVIVYQLDRFARDRYASAINKAKLKKNGVRVLSARENISDDPSGILMESVLEGMAEYYSAELGQKIKRGMDLNASKCLSTGGNIALGYYVDNEKRFHIDPNTAPIVEQIFRKYAQGSTMADIIRYLNEIHIITSKGNSFHKTGLRVILTNKRYKGIYTYRGTEIKDGIPRIISDELFEEVQLKMEKNKKAPARSKAKVDYILTTKLFCGQCESMMSGVSGNGRSGKKYCYYACNNNKKKLCGKKSIPKDKLEDLVVNETKALLTDENIDMIAKEVVALSKNESNTPTLKRLQKLLRENKKGTTNLIKALETGQAAKIITEQITKRQKERTEIEKQIANEKIHYPILTVQQVKFFMERFKSGNINDMKYRKALVDTFIRKIILYDDRMTILYNIQDGQNSVLSGEKCSSMETMVVLTGLEPVTPSM